MAAFLLSAPVSAQGFFEVPAQSNFNGGFPTPPDSGWSYTIYAGGHLYGAHNNAQSIYPAASFLGNIHRLNQRPAQAFIALGDIVRDGQDSLQLQAIVQATKALKVPFYNAPGNHDIAGGDRYLKRFGHQVGTMFQKKGHDVQARFYIGDDLFLILNTEHLLSGNTDKILEFLSFEMARAKSRLNGVRHIFVFTHRLLWPVCVDAFAEMDAYLNEPLAPKVDREKTCAIFDRIAGFKPKGETYFFAGDIGADWSLPIFYDKDPDRGWHYLACGLNDSRRDALLKMEVNPEGKVILGTFPLGEARYSPLKDYNLAHWKAHFEKSPPESTGLVGRIMGLFGKKAFWAGGLAGLGLMLGFGFLWRRMRKRA
ncbi:MAG: metallophosphoesterase family protein [Bacteroidota bacterium]